MSLNYFAFIANLFNRRSYFHCITFPFVRLFRTPGYTAFCRVINRNLNCDLISRQYPDIIYSEFARQMSIYNVSIGQFDLELCIGHCLNDRSLKLYYIILRQNYPSLINHTLNPALFSQPL